MKKIIFLLNFIFLFANDLSDAYIASYNYEKNRNYSGALSVLKSVYKENSKNYTLNLRIAYLFLLNQEYRKSLLFYQRASIILPFSFEPKFGMMKVYFALKNYQEILNIGFALIKRNKYDYYANLYTLQALIELKKNKEAMDIINKMLDVYPTDIIYLTYLAKLYESINPKYAKKIYLRSVLLLDPDNISAKMFLKNTKK